MNAFSITRTPPVSLPIPVSPADTILLATRPTHDHRHVSVVDDVGANATEDSSPDFAESARANDYHVGIALLRQLDDTLSRLPVTDDVPPGDLQGQCNRGHQTQMNVGLTS